MMIHYVDSIHIIVLLTVDGIRWYHIYCMQATSYCEERNGPQPQLHLMPKCRRWRRWHYCSTLVE